MAKTLAELNVLLSLRDKTFGKALKTVENKMYKFSRKVQGLGLTLSASLTAPLAAIGVQAVRNFDKQAKAVAQVEQGLISTGNTAGKTLEELKSIAKDLQKDSLFGDEDILQKATAQLLTFTNISGNEFDRVQQAALDLATRLDGDLKAASIRLGKALNDPIANLGALGESGIQFSEKQKVLIKSLAKTGQLAEAQRIILAELEKQYGGSAKAASEAGLGPIKQLQNSISDLTEELGEILLPTIRKVVEKIKEIAEKFKSLSPEMKENIVKWALIAAAIGPVLVAVGSLVSAGRALVVVLQLIVAHPVIAALALIAGGLFYAYKNSELFRTSIDALSTINLDKLRAGLEGIWRIMKGVAALAPIMAGALPNLELLGLELPEGSGGAGAPSRGQLGGPAKPKPILNTPTFDDLGGGEIEKTITLLEKLERVKTSLRSGDQLERSGSIGLGFRDGELEALSSGLQAFKIDMEAATDGTDRFNLMLSEINQHMEKMAEIGLLIGDVLTTSFLGAFDAIAEGGNAFKALFAPIGQLIKKLIAAALAAAALNFILNAIGIGGASVGKLSKSLGGFKGILGSLTGLPFARGGMTTGPTNAIIGDNPSGKEAVIPFERMGEFINMIMPKSGGSEVVFRIQGSELIGVIENADRDMSRKRGYSLQ